MNQNLKSNFMQRCVVTRDPLWHAMLVCPLLWRWGHMALSIQHLSSSVWCGVGTMVDTGLIIWPTPLIYILTPHWTRHMSPVTAPAALLTTTFARMGGSRNQLHNKLTSREGTERLCIFRNILHSSSHPMQRTERRIMLCLGLYFVSSCKLEMS